MTQFILVSIFKGPTMITQFILLITCEIRSHSTEYIVEWLAIYRSAEVSGPIVVLGDSLIAPLSWVSSDRDYAKV